MQPMKRIQGNIVARQERRFLNWACSVMPEQVSSDHLTAFGVFGAVLVVVGYVAGRSNVDFLWIAALGYVIHWFGDSLDGSLARYRNVSRPRYGYFLDHSLDVFCIVLMVGGMGLSSFARMDVAMYVVVAYLILAIHVFLKNHVTGTFQLSFIALGPTELRMVFVAITVWMIIQGGDSYHLALPGVSGYDIALLVTGTVLFTLFIVNSVTMVLHLRALEGDGRRPLPAIEPARAAGARQASDIARDRRSASVQESSAY
ncbi:CDP-alcohol phosphatidyltransferase family protein [Lichenihabitans psoromatis]|uniref:CDP-alcohol phosphatidyltransferase family protein n=1 Tax=Lichenihabitans psoromatis TaxID=2528642 RepID=UPI00103681A7|nr:CDP-alcohol phosphatidyltransferase family protein [Lichenihabitans psoromatis]